MVVWSGGVFIRENIDLPAKDRYHDTGVNALQKASWAQISEQVGIIVEDRRWWIDIRAAKETERLAIRMRSGGKTGIVLRGESGLTGTVSHEGSAQAVEDRTRRWATGFDPSQDTFDQPAAMIGLSAMRSAPPDHRVTPGALGTVVGGVEPWD